MLTSHTREVGLTTTEGPTQQTQGHPRAYSSGEGTVLLGPTGHLLRKATSPTGKCDRPKIIHRNKYRELGKIRKQRNMFQTKEQDKTSEKELNEVEINSPPNKEFKVMTIKMLNELGKRMDEPSEKLNTVKKYKEEPNRDDE